MSCRARKPTRATTRTLGLIKGPLEVQEAIESIVASLPLMAESFVFGEIGDAEDHCEQHQRK